MAKRQSRKKNPKFLTDYDEVFALGAYVIARLMLYRGDEKSSGKSVDFVRKLIRGRSPNHDPKPPRAPWEVAGEIVAMLMFNPGRNVSSRVRVSVETDGAGAAQSKRRRT